MPHLAEIQATLSILNFIVIGQYTLQRWKLVCARNLKLHLMMHQLREQEVE